jgi:16S rRNA (cytidine1402-2'-O)-methyltransferase
MAVALSGLPSDRFVFEGFLPRKGGERRKRLDSLAREERTAVLFVAPSRLKADLKALGESLGVGRPLVVTRELTKVHEEIWRGNLGDGFAEWTERQPRGEFTIVIGGADPIIPTLEEAVAAANALIEDGMSRADAARHASDETGVAKRLIYEALHQG